MNKQTVKTVIDALIKVTDAMIVKDAKGKVIQPKDYASHDIYRVQSKGKTKDYIGFKAGKDSEDKVIKYCTDNDYSEYVRLEMKQFVYTVQIYNEVMKVLPKEPEMKIVEKEVFINVNDENMNPIKISSYPEGKIVFRFAKKDNENDVVFILLDISTPKERLVEIAKKIKYTNIRKISEFSSLLKEKIPSPKKSKPKGVSFDDRVKDAPDKPEKTLQSVDLPLDIVIKQIRDLSN